MALLLHRPDGVVKVWCARCSRLHDRAVCGRDRRREYVPGGSISMWNQASYLEYERSEAGRSERREWEREMLSMVDEA